MKTLMVIGAKRKQIISAPEQREERTSEKKRQRRKVVRSYAQLQDLWKEATPSPEKELRRTTPVLMMAV